MNKVNYRNDQEERFGKDWLGLRALTLPQTVNEEARSIDVVISTEKPVLEYDFSFGGRIDTVLLNSAFDLASISKAPLVDSHDRFSLEHVLGSVSNLRIEGEELVGTATFSSIAESEWTKVREGHLGDVSVAWRTSASTILEEGQSQVIEGKSFNGPIKVITEGRLVEVSLVAVGANDEAKVRNFEKEKGEEKMNKKALEALKRKLKKEADDEARAELEKEIKRGEAELKAKEEQARADDKAKKQERERASSILELGRQHNLDDEARSMVADGTEF